MKMLHKQKRFLNENVTRRNMVFLSISFFVILNENVTLLVIILLAYMHESEVI